MINVLMIGVDKTSVGGMWTVVENYMHDSKFQAAVNMTYISTTINKHPIIKILYFIQAFLRILVKLTFGRIDIVHIQMGDNISVLREGLVGIVSKCYGKRLIIHMHGGNISVTHQNASSFRRKLNAKVFGKADKVLVLGEHWRSFMEELVGSPEKVDVLYNGVQVPSERMYNIQAKEIMFLGIIHPEKGVLDLLDAAKILDEKLPSDYVFKLYGDDKFKMIHSEIDQRQLNHRVKFMGWLTADQRPEVLHHTVLNVLPSYHEGLPMTILETMAYGIPNVATNVGAIPEVIQPGMNGELISVKSVKELSDSIEKTLSSFELRKAYSEQSHKLLLEKFSVEAHIAHVLSIYNHLV